MFPNMKKIPAPNLLMSALKSALTVNDSLDLPLNYSVTPYQGCEHGCIYCYARNSHQYWGYNSGLGFEPKIFGENRHCSTAEKTIRKKELSAPSHHAF